MATETFGNIPFLVFQDGMVPVELVHHVTFNEDRTAAAVFTKHGFTLTYKVTPAA
jgi:hypothetical protein